MIRRKLSAAAAAFSAKFQGDWSEVLAGMAHDFFSNSLAAGEKDVVKVFLEKTGDVYKRQVVGIVNIKGNISTIHSYNRRKVKEEDIPKYGKTVGTGTLIIGISLVLGFIVSFWSEIIIDYIILPAVIVGLGFILYGQFKYNKGIF